MSRLKSTVRRLLKIRSALEKGRPLSLSKFLDEYEKALRLEGGSVLLSQLRQEVAPLLKKRIFDEVVSDSAKAAALVKRAKELLLIEEEVFLDLVGFSRSLEDLFHLAEATKRAFVKKLVSLLSEEKELRRVARDEKTFLRLIEVFGAREMGDVFRYLIDLRELSHLKTSRAAAAVLLKKSVEFLLEREESSRLRFEIWSEDCLSLLDLSEVEKKVFRVEVVLPDLEILDEFDESFFPEEAEILSEAFSPELWSLFPHHNSFLVSLSLLRKGFRLNDLTFMVANTKVRFTKLFGTEAEASFCAPWLLFGNPSERKEIVKWLRDRQFELESECAKALSGFDADFERIGLEILERSSTEKFLKISQHFQQKCGVSLVEKLPPEKRFAILQKTRTRKKRSSPIW